MQASKAATSVAIALLIMFVAVGVGYIGYRYWGAQEAKKINLLYSTKHIPPVQCSMATVSFTGPTQQKAYIANGMFRMDSKDYKDGMWIITHTLVDVDRNFYIWGESGTGVHLPPIGPSTKVPDSVLPIDVTNPVSISLTCSPWWNPDRSVFEVPYDSVNFTTISPH